jgi:CHAT domain-containing protein
MSPRGVVIFLQAFPATLLLLVTLGCPAGPAPDEVPPEAGEPTPEAAERFLPVPGSEVEHKLQRLQAHSYQVDLAADEYLHLTVEQRGVDLTVLLFDDRGQMLVAVDSPNGRRESENLWILAPKTGRYQLKVHASDGVGTYGLRLVARRPASAQDRQRAEAAAALAEGERLRITRGAEQGQEARAHYERALALWQHLGEPAQQAVVLVRLGEVSRLLGDRQRQLRNYQEALRVLRGMGLAGQEVYAFLEVGKARRAEADPSGALAAFQEALRLTREIKERSEEATALNNIAVLFEQEGRMQEAFSLYRETLAIYRETGRRDWIAAVLVNLGFSHILSGQLEEAREALEEALELDRQAGRTNAATDVLLHLGWISYLEGNHPAALEFYDQALDLSRAAESLEDEANILDRQGTAYRELGELEKALASYQRARQIFREIDKTTSLAHVEANLGWLYLRQGDAGRAASFFEPSLVGFRKAGERHGEASTLFLGAQIARQQGRLEKARRWIEEALRIVESNRTASDVGDILDEPEGPPRQDLEKQAIQISYLSSRYEYYELYIDLLMELDAREPGAGHAAEALAVVERSRARSLLDQMTQAGASNLAKVNESSFAARPLGLEEVRRELLDETTLLLVYSLGRKRSFVWAVGQASMTTRVLAGSEEIEDLAAGFHLALSLSRRNGARMQAQVVGAELSRLVLEPIAERLEGPRIVVMADGALHLVPFGALPKPGGGGEPLLAGHEVAHIPSVSVAAGLHQRHANGEQSRSVAILADPVFTPDDPRGTASGTPASGTTHVAPRNLAPLPHSRLEAEAILALLPEGTPHLKALGFEARRELVTSGKLDAYRFLHFATHGVLDTEHPERSGIVLSMFDDQGRPIDGLLRAQDIYPLDLSADLVVLSGCRTALGRRFRGEGVLGLPHAFLHAGASRVVVSLWDVSDEATAELMKRFYQGIFSDQLRPTEALHRAQRSMRSEERWQDPVYWAAFVLQGDWR